MYWNKKLYELKTQRICKMVSKVLNSENIQLEKVTTNNQLMREFNTSNSSQDNEISNGIPFSTRGGSTVAKWPREGRADFSTTIATHGEGCSELIGAQIEEKN